MVNLYYKGILVTTLLRCLKKKDSLLLKLVKNWGGKMAIKSDIVEACAVWFGEFVDYDTCQLTDNNDPEKQLLIKDALAHLSKEAGMVANVLLNLPDEMFTNSGRVIRKNLIQYMETNFNWTVKKTKKAQEEIARLLI